MLNLVHVKLPLGFKRLNADIYCLIIVVVIGLPPSQSQILDPSPGTDSSLPFLPLALLNLQMRPMGEAPYRPLNVNYCDENLWVVSMSSTQPKTFFQNFFCQNISGLWIKQTELFGNICCMGFKAIC
jgi:hypothetical protein